MATPIVLAYNLSTATEALLEVVCNSRRVQLKPVSPEEYSRAIGSLAGIPMHQASAAERDVRFPEPMLVMCHMLKPELDAFLDALRQSGAPSIPLKAILTPTNATWNARMLRDELMREHEAVMRKLGKRP